MSDTPAIDRPPLLTDEERSTTLWQLLDALIENLSNALKSDKPPKALMLDVARKFLADQGVNVRSRPDLRRGMDALAELRNLPFDKDGNRH